MQTKSCKKCLCEKPLEEYHLKSGGLFGRHSICKLCVSRSKRLHFKRKKQAKKQRETFRSMQIGKGPLQTRTVYVQIAEDEAFKVVRMLTEAINNQYLSNWESDLWVEQQEESESLMVYPMGA